MVVTGLAVAIPLASSAGANDPGNLARARTEATRLLGLLQVPPDAVAVSAGPHGASGVPGYDEATPNLVDAHQWWKVHGEAGRVLAYVTSHLPRGARWFMTESGGPAPESRTESYKLPPVAGVLSERVLSVSVVQLTSTTTWVRTDGEAVWIVPRPAGEKVPSGVHEIGITSAYPGKSAIATLSVTDPAKVEQIVLWINELGIGQPRTINCPVLGGPTVTFAFHGAGGGLLARASGMDFEGTSGECNPISFSIRARPEPALIGGNFFGRVQRLLGVNLESGKSTQRQRVSRQTTSSQRPAVLDVLHADGIAGIRFGAAPQRVRAAIESLLDQRGGAYEAAGGAECGLDHAITWADDWTASGQPELTTYFGRSRFLGYQVGTPDRPRHQLRGWALATTRGLGVGDALTRGRQLYGRAFSLGSEQGGVWRLRTASGRIDGYAWGTPSYGDVSWHSLVATIDAGDVGCPAIAP
jgi:hypothetical protein